MKAAPFAYVRPGSVDDVLAELAGGRDIAGGAKVLAGGQSLVPVLAMRLGRPATLVDIGAVRGLDELRGGPDALRVGATVRQRRLEHSAEAAAVPLLGMALPFVGHRELRSRGTVCGSLAHADPAAELPAVAACLDAVLEIAGPAGRRRVPAAEFTTGAMTTAVGPEEVLVAVEFPVARPGEGFGFAEIARRHGDFALAGVVTRVRRGDDGGVTEARLTAFGVSDRPVTRDVTRLVRDAAGAEPALREGTAALAADVVDTAGDAHGSPGYRRRLLGVLAARELARAHRAADRKERA
jgi:2-furoyl-CoA dehydrogenase FAD binding subunit